MAMSSGLVPTSSRQCPAGKFGHADVGGLCIEMASEAIGIKRQMRGNV